MKMDKMLEYTDEVMGIESDGEPFEDYSEICEDYDDDDIEMTFKPEHEWGGSNSGMELRDS